MPCLYGTDSLTSGYLKHTILLSSKSQNVPVQKKKRLAMERRGKLEDLDRSFDLAYWQAQGDSAKFAAAWELVVFAHRLKGLDERELRLQRTAEDFQRLPG